jgi:hypothetical protein
VRCCAAFEPTGDSRTTAGVERSAAPKAARQRAHSKAFAETERSPRLAFNERAFILPEMPTVALQAHFDGERIVLDEPFNLPPHAALIVTVLPGTADTVLESEEAWLRSVASSDAFAYLADPAEDVYTAEDGEPFHDAV